MTGLALCTRVQSSRFRDWFRVYFPTLRVLAPQGHFTASGTSFASLHFVQGAALGSGFGLGVVRVDMAPPVALDDIHTYTPADLHKNRHCPTNESAQL